MCKAIKTGSSEYEYRGWLVYRVGAEWYIKPKGEAYASDVLDTKRQAIAMIDSYLIN